MKASKKIIQSENEVKFQDLNKISLFITIIISSLIYEKSFVLNSRIISIFVIKQTLAFENPLFNSNREISEISRLCNVMTKLRYGESFRSLRVDFHISLILSIWQLRLY